VDHPTWRALGFGFDYAHAFSFEFVSSSSPEGARFRATAHGDLDGDGVVSTFELKARATRRTEILPGMYVDREVE